MAPPQVTISPTLTVTVQANNDLQPKQLITIGNLSFIATVIFYNQFFAVQGGVQTFPGQSVPFNSDPTAPNTNNCPIVYVKNNDNNSVLGLNFTVPQGTGGGAGGTTNIFNLAPGGVFLFFNPANVTSGAAIVGGTNPGPVGLGASTGTPGGFTLNLFNLASAVAGNNTPMYAEVLLAG